MGAALGIFIATATWVVHEVLGRILEIVIDAGGRDKDHKLSHEEALTRLDEKLEEQLDKIDYAACVDLLRGLGPEDDDKWPQRAIDAAKDGGDPLVLLREALGDEDFEAIFNPFYAPIKALGNQDVADLESKMFMHFGQAVSATCQPLLAKGS